VATGTGDTPPIPRPTPEQAAPVQGYVPAPPVQGYVPPPPVAGYLPAVPSPAGGYLAYAPARPRSLSVASLACGIAGVVFSVIFFGFGFGLAAVITGHLAVKRQPWGRSFWLTGLITGYVALAISLIEFLVLLVIFLLPFLDYGY
jgi:hypothetical protein